MVSALAIRPRVRGFRPSRGDGFSRATKIRSTPSVGGEVKPETPRRRILRNVIITCKYEQKYFARPNPFFLSPVPLASYNTTLLVGLPEISCGRVSFPLSSFNHGSPCSYIIWGGGNRPVVGRGSETQSHPIYIIITITTTTTARTIQNTNQQSRTKVQK
jgi:hypothetical protein